MPEKPHAYELRLPPDVDLHPKSELRDPYTFEFFDVVANGRYQIIDSQPIRRRDVDIYRATDWENPKQDVAIKIFREINEDIRHLVTRELAVNIALNGLANILSPIDMGVIEEGRFPQRYLATPFADRTFNDFQYVPGDIDNVREVVDMGTDIAIGLDNMHTKGFIHKDVKPSNIFGFDQEDGSTRWRLGDFGLSVPVFFPAEGDSEALPIWMPLKKGELTGTRGYEAPELLDQSDNLSPKVDIIAAGITLCEGFTGKRPFPSPNHETYLIHITRETQVEPRVINGAVPAELSMLSLNCIKRAPQDRLDAKSLAIGLQAVRNSLAGALA